MCGKTKSFLIFLLTLSFLIGLSLCLYPIVNGAILDISAEKEADKFLEHLKDHAPPNDDALNLLPTPSDPTRSHAELWDAVTAYNQQIWQEKQSGLSDPWAYEQPSFLLERYGIEDGIFATISIPRLELTLPLYLGATNEHMASGAVHLSQTSLPVGGNNTNCVIAGHRGWKGAKFFRDIVALVPGDEVIITNLWEELHYTVTGSQIIPPYDVQKILIQPGSDMLTLLTCWYANNGAKDRFIVYCQRSA